MSPHVRQISERATLSTNIKPKCYVGLAHAPWAHGAHSTGDINLLPSLRVLFHELSSQLTRFSLTYLLPVSASPRLMSRRCVAVLSASSLSAAAAAAALAVDELSAALLRRFVDDRRSTEKSARGIDDSRRNL